MKELADKLKAIVKNESAAVGLPTPTLVVEPGRAIAGPGTITLYEVGTVKDVAISADRAPPLCQRGRWHERQHPARPVQRRVRRAAGVPRSATRPPVLARIVGKHCESGDIIVRDTWVSEDLVPGDLLAVAATGAYCYSMSSRYNLLRRPAVVAVKDGKCAADPAPGNRRGSSELGGGGQQ